MRNKESSNKPHQQNKKYLNLGCADREMSPEKENYSIIALQEHEQYHSSSAAARLREHRRTDSGERSKSLMAGKED